jgi:hypothetical protein
MADDILAAFPVLFASDISLTALDESPSPEADCIIAMVVVYKPSTPIPIGPSSTATILDRTIPIMMLKT